MHLGLARRQCRRSLGHAALLTIAAVGCDANDTVQPIAGLPGAEFAIVSNPVSPGRSGSASAYVSLLPGTLAEATKIIIANERTGQEVEAPVQDGGLDPVAVAAVEGDPLILTIKTPGGFPQSLARAVVPGRRPPRVVRVNPPRGRRDVAINASIVVVFSEPVDPATVTDKSIRLEAGDGAVVPGSVGVAADGLSATYIPGQDLAPDTEYRIAVTAEVRDRDGSPVEAPLVSSFRTEGIPTVPTPIPPALSSNVIAFRNYFGGIMLIAADGGASVSIFGTSDQDDEPSWSPDGRSIALSRGRYAGAGAGEIIVLSADGSGTVRHIGSGIAPAWSPDGTRIAFESHESGNGEIWLMNPDGSERVRLTENPEEDAAPAWSPDGRKLAFVRDGEIFVMNADGSDARSLGQVGGSPAWSPDGTRIAFDRLITADESWNIWVMNADGSEVRQVTHNAPLATSYDPTWSPDGRRIAFAHAPEENIPYQIYVIDADGSGMMHVGPDRSGQGLISASYAPAWSPR